MTGLTFRLKPAATEGEGSSSIKCARLCEGGGEEDELDELELGPGGETDRDGDLPPFVRIDAEDKEFLAAAGLAGDGDAKPAPRGFLLGRLLI
jgi:hypothetical protein